MPWLHQVAGVIEAWYPGEQDGASIAALLFGDVDPSGRLPVTFPTGQAGSPIDTPSQWPGVGLTSTYSEGLEVGYRYDHATGTVPLFPFGFGLSYTRFSLGHLALQRSDGGVVVRLSVTDTGRRAGVAVPEVYLTQPPAAGEPPAQLAGFATVGLAPGQRRTVSIHVPSSAFTAFVGGTWTTVPGTYTVSVGQSSASLPLSATLAVS
jgi:beta-glucosidase